MQSLSGDPTAPSLRYFAIPWLVCLAACLTVDIFYFPAATTFPDEQRLLGAAIRLAATGEYWTGADRAWEMPGAPAFFAIFVKLFGAEAAILPIRTAQAVLLVVQSALLAFMAQRIFSDRLAALAAASLAAIYPFLLFYQGLLLSETLFNTFLVAALAALYWWRERGRRADVSLVVACLLFAAATLTKATLTILPPLLIAATAWAAGGSPRKILTVTAAAACLYAAFLSPWWIRNAVVLDAFVPFTTSSAQNLYLGNNPGNTNAGVDWSKDVEPDAAARMLAMQNEVERQRAFAKRATDYIKQDPAAFLRNAAKKFVRLWNLVPNAAEFNRGLYAAASALSFGTVLALALIGAWRRRQQWRALLPLYLVIAYFTLTHIVTIASLRYRLPIEPILILLAAEPLAALAKRLRPRTVRFV